MGSTISGAQLKQMHANGLLTRREIDLIASLQDAAAALEAASLHASANVAWRAVLAALPKCTEKRP